MANETSRLLSKHLRKLTTAARADGLTDRELVERFALGRDEESFAALVRRHGPMVMRICNRVLHNGHDAEDVFQATFLVLSRKAGSLRRRDSVGCFLHGVAYRLALKTRTQLAQQRKHESQAAVEKRADDPLAELSVREAQTILDEELARLPEKYRAPLVSCCLEGKSREEAARQLGWSSKLIKSRLEQGRERLHQRLTRRGLTLPAALGATLLTEEAASPSLSAELVRAAVQMGRTCSGNAVKASVALLAESAVRSTAIGKAKVVILGLLLLTGALAAGMGAFAPPQPPEKQAEAPAAAKAEAPETAKPEKPQPARTFRVLVIDPQGKPLADTKVHSSIWTHKQGSESNHDYQTDAAGVAQVELPRSFYFLRLQASKKGFAPVRADWEQNEPASPEKLPAEYVFRMERAVTAGGRIVDGQDKPIVGAKVEVMIVNNPKSVRGDSRTRYETFLAGGSDAVDAATTDAEGRWRIDNVPDHPQVELSLMASHPEYVSDRRWHEAQRADGVTMARLRDGTATLQLKRGVIVRGRVTDPAGKPIKDALVCSEDSGWVITDSDGRYRLPPWVPAQVRLTVLAYGWAPQMRRTLLRAEMPPQEFRLAPGKPIRLRIVDAAGKAVPKAFISIIDWKGNKSLESLQWLSSPSLANMADAAVPRQANADGVWQWDAAPIDSMKLKVRSEGYATSELEIAGGAAERMVVLKAEHRITGRVTDAVTGELVPAFTVIPLDVFRKDFIHAERNNAVMGKNGRLDYLAERTDIPLRLRVEAPGYRTQDGPEFRVGSDSSRKQDFRLQPSEPISGVVCDATGKPVAKAEVLLATPTEEVALRRDRNQNHKTSTNAEGCFTFPDPGEPFTVVAQADAGFALAEFPAGQHYAGTLRLRPWASIRGQFRDGGQPVRGATVLLSLVRIYTLDRPRINTTPLQTVTSPDGRFEFPRVPPGPVCVWPYLGPWQDESFRSAPHMPLALKPGQRVELDLGGGATIVKGKVKLTGKVPEALDCNYSINYLVERTPGIEPPPEIARLGFDAKKGWRDAWTQTPEGQAYMNTLRHWFVKLAPDGSFRISGVPVGEYDLAIAVYAKPDG